MKLNSKRSETESGTQPRSIRDQNDPSIGSKLFKHCCGKHEALLKLFLRSLESNLKPICAIMNGNNVSIK